MTWDYSRHYMLLHVFHLITNFLEFFTLAQVVYRFLKCLRDPTGIIAPKTSKTSLAMYEHWKLCPLTASCLPLRSGSWQAVVRHFQYVPKLRRCRGHTNMCATFLLLKWKIPAKTKLARSQEFFPWKDDNTSGGLKCQRYILKWGSGEMCPLNYPRSLLSLIFMKHTSILSISRFTNATIFVTHLLWVSENICTLTMELERKN